MGYKTVETWGQVCSGLATVALLVSSAAGYASSLLGQAQAQRFKSLSVWAAVAGAGVLLLSVIFRGVGPRANSSLSASPISSVGDRAAWAALVAALLSAGPRLKSILTHKTQDLSWAAMLPVAVLAGFSVIPWQVKASTAPALLLCTLIAAGLWLWAAGQGLHLLIKNSAGNRWAVAVAVAGLTVNLLAVGGVNWRVWGSPTGTASVARDVSGASLGLAAVWLVGTAGSVLHRKSVKFASLLHLVAAILLVGIALNVQWALPFS